MKFKSPISYTFFRYWNKQKSKMRDLEIWAKRPWNAVNRVQGQLQWELRGPAAETWAAESVLIKLKMERGFYWKLLKATGATFWQRICLHSLHVPKLKGIA